MKRKWLHELPYLLIALYATKIGQAWRLAEGTDAAHKLLTLMDSLSASFASPLPSFELHDLSSGCCWARAFVCSFSLKKVKKRSIVKGVSMARHAGVRRRISSPLSIPCLPTT